MSQSSTYAFNFLWLIAPRCLQNMQWHGSTAECILTLRISQGLPWLTESSCNEHALNVLVCTLYSILLHLHMLNFLSLHRFIGAWNFKNSILFNPSFRYTIRMELIRFLDI